MVNNWYVSINIKQAKPSLYEGLRKVESPDTILFISGVPLDCNFMPVSDEDLMQELESSLDVLQRLQGGYSGAFIKKDKILIFNDRTCMHRIYFTIYNDHLFASNLADTVASKSGRELVINYKALSEMLFSYAILNHHTYYNDIHTLNIAEVAEVNRITSTFRWIKYDSAFGRGLIDDRPIEMIAKDIYNEMNECIESASSRYGKKLSATITAGLDSRLVVGIAHNLGLQLPLFSTDTDVIYNEHEIIRPLLAYLNTTCEYYPLPDGYYMKNAVECYSKIDFHCFCHVWFNEAVSQRKELQVMNMMGIGGGELLRFCNGNSRYMDINPLFTSDNGVELYQKLICFNNRLDLFNDDFYDTLTGAFRIGLSESVSSFLNMPRGLMDWFIKTQLFNSTLYCYSMYAEEIQGFSPYLSPKVLDILFALPQDVGILGEPIYRALYQLVDPALLDFPSTRDKNHEKVKLYAKNPKLHCHDSILWIKEQLLSGMAVKDKLLDDMKILDYFKRMDRSGNYSAFSNLLSIFLFSTWYDSFRIRYK